MRLRDIDTIHHDNRTLCDVFNGEAVWVKYAVVPRRLYSRLFFQAAGEITGHSIFKSTHNPDGVSALRAEAARLRYMQEKGYLVPHIHEQHEKHLVLSDVGTCLKTAVDMSRKPEDRRSLLTLAASHLAAVHSDGEYHGRARAKDMTIKNMKIGMIDLEHEPLKVMSLPEAQARDLWYLYFDAAEHQRDDAGLVGAMMDAYAEKAPAEAVDSLHSAMKIMTPITTMLKCGLSLARQDNYISKVADMNTRLLAKLDTL